MIKAALMIAALAGTTTFAAVTPLDQIVANLGAALDKIESYSANADILQCFG